MTIDGTAERRSHPRNPVRLRARFRAGGRFADATVTDISATGARVACRCAPSPDGTGTLEIDTFVRMAGRVVWQDAESFGFRFFDDHETVQGLLKANHPDLELRALSRRTTPAALHPARGSPQPR